MPEPDDLAQIHAHEAKIAKLEHELEKAKADYHSAISKLYFDGKSMRKIAKLLGVSHQRVHQIIDPKNQTVRVCAKPTQPDLRCSFCDLRADQVKKLVQGPNILACDICITSCHMALAINCPGSSVMSRGNDFKTIPIASELRCSFCGKSPSSKRDVVAGTNYQVCDKCIGLAMTHMQELPKEVAKVATTKPLLSALNKMTVILTLRIQRNSKWVRGMKRTIEDIEWVILPHYLPKHLGDSEYELEIKYKDDADLDEKINDLLTECHRMADMRNCFSESSIKQKGVDRWWD